MIDSYVGLTKLSATMKSPEEAAFDVEHLQTCFSRGKAYECSGNAMWCVVGAGVQGGIPFNSRVREQLMNYYFKQPAEYPWKIHVPVGDGEDPSKMYGRMTNMAPPEGWHSFIGAMARDCRKKDNADNTWNHSGDIARAALGNISFNDAHKRSTGTVPDCTGIPAQWSATATSCIRQRPSCRNGFSSRL